MELKPALWSGLSRGFMAIVLLHAVTAWSADIDKEFEEEKPWAEIEVRLPAFPVEANLIPFTVGAVSDTRFFIDGNSLSIGADEVIRYTLVIISAGGARNISFEGMRCGTAEKRVYAFGRSDGSWSRAKSDRWVRIRGGDNNHNVELFANYFCPAGVSNIAKAEDARRALLYGGKPSGTR